MGAVKRPKPQGRKRGLRVPAVRRDHWVTVRTMIMSVHGPGNRLATVVIGRRGARGYVVVAQAHSDDVTSMGEVFDTHAHAIIAEKATSLAQAKRLGDAWARKFRKGLVLAPCACEAMVEARPPMGTAAVPLLPARGMTDGGIIGRLEALAAKQYPMRKSDLDLEPLDLDLDFTAGELANLQRKDVPRREIDRP